MGRMKKGQPGHEEAVKKWRKSMVEKYGSEKALHEAMQKMGAKGGAVSNTGGFASNRELARIAGAKGGSISRRGDTLQGKKAEAKRDEIIAMLDMGVSKAEIARRTGIHYASLVYWIKTKLGR